MYDQTWDFIWVKIILYFNLGGRQTKLDQVYRCLFTMKESSTTKKLDNLYKKLHCLSITTWKRVWFPVHTQVRGCTWWYCPKQISRNNLTPAFLQTEKHARHFFFFIGLWQKRQIPDLLTLCKRTRGHNRPTWSHPQSELVWHMSQGAHSFSAWCLQIRGHQHWVWSINRSS